MPITDKNKNSTELLTDIKEETADKKVFADILKTLTSMSSNIRETNRILEKEKVEKLKEKTTTKPTTVKTESDNTDKEKDMSFLRQTFQDTFSGIKDFLSPSGLLKSFGLFSGSPVFMLLGDKLDNLIDNYKDYRTEKKQRDDELLSNQQDATKNSFLQEQQRDEEMAIKERTNELLEELIEKPFEIKEKDRGLMDMVKAPLSIFSKLLPKSLLSIFGSSKMLKVFGKLFSGGGALKGLGKVGGLLKTGGKFLGKLALPLAAITAGIDFVSGFQNALEITGRDDLSAKIQAGLSEAISGFTFGLIDPKSISQSIDMINDKLAQIFWDSFDYIKGVFDGKIDFIGDISSILADFSLGLFTVEDIETGLKTFKDKIISFFNAPMELFESIVSGKNLLDSINNFIGNITLGIITVDNIKTVFDTFKNKIADFIKEPFEMFKEIFTIDNVMTALKKSLSLVTFNMFSPEEIGNIINVAVEKIKDIITMPIKMLQTMWEIGKEFVFDKLEKIKNVTSSVIDGITGIFNNISDSIKNLIDDIVGIIKDRYEDLVSKIENIVDIVKNPFEALKNKIFGEEKTETTPIYRGKIPKREVSPIETYTKNIDTVNSIRRENIIIEKIKKEDARQRRMEIENKNYREVTGSNDIKNTVLSNNINNNIMPQEDMSIKNDDPNWGMFSLQY